MSRPSRRVRAPVAALVLSGLLPLAGLAATAPFHAAAAQEAAAPEADAPPSRRGRGRGRGRDAAREAARKPATPPGMQQATPLATFGDWNVFTGGQGRDRLCYAIAQPQARTPKTLARDTAYLFVTVRKGAPAAAELAVMFGFKPRPAASQTRAGAAAAPSDPYLAVGASRFGLVVKDENAWVQNQGEEPRIVAEMGRTQAATVKTVSARGNPTSDEYALGGFTEAMKRTREECK